MAGKRLILWLWVMVILIDYYLQFFSSRYWTDHALPFLQKFGQG